MTIQQRIFDIMESKNLKASDLSRYADIPTSTISAWKTKNSSPSSDKISVIAEFLGVSISHLLGVDEPNAEDNTIIMHGNSFAAGYIKGSTVTTDLFGNKDVSDAYNSLSPTEKLEIQIEILKKADKK